MSAAEHGGVPRREWFKTGAALGAAAAAGAGAGAGPAAGGTASAAGADRAGHHATGGGPASPPTAPGTGGLVLHNDKIHTMNPAQDVVRTVAIRAGRIVYTGTSLHRALQAVPGRPRVI